MKNGRSRWASRSMSVLLVALGLVVGILVYGLVSRMVAPRVDPLRDENPAQLVGDIIQVEVRNGCGISGLAAVATMYLRRHGFDVVAVGDYTSFDNEHSMVIDRAGDLESARKVATVLGIPAERVVQDVKPDYYLDASVVIGKDFETLRPFRGD